MLLRAPDRPEHEVLTIVISLSAQPGQISFWALTSPHLTAPHCTSPLTQQGPVTEVGGDNRGRDGSSVRQALTARGRAPGVSAKASYRHVHGTLWCIMTHTLVFGLERLG
jgi:hypothetical protein